MTHAVPASPTTTTHPVRETTGRSTPAEQLGLPVFSIVMPTFNRAHLIERAIRSVLGQSFGDFGLVIVDDASTDHTEEVIHAFDDDRIVYVRRDANGGNVRARNDGLRKAQGRYIAFRQ